MMAESVGMLDRVDIREVWRDESGNFTPWLSRQENLQILADSLGLALEPYSSEERVGPFSADILCRSVFDDSWVVIENQYGKTDHDHLGKLLTYAAGLHAKTVIWIAEAFTDEHRAALDLLNEATTDEYNYFGVELELLRIGDSAPAPRFNIACQPNEWARTVKRGATAPAELTSTQVAQLQFWTEFKDFMATSSQIPCSKPWPGGWITHPIGRTGFNIGSIYSKWNSERHNYSTGELRTELVLTGKDAPDQFTVLMGDSDQIQQEFDEALVWYDESPSQRRVYVRRDIDFDDREGWPEYREWLKGRVERINSVFRDRIRDL